MTETNAQAIRRLTAERDAALRDAASWKREYESVNASWLRALGGKVFNKRHRIDALVMTTRWFVANHAAWEAQTAQMIENARLRALADTLGVSVASALKPVIDVEPSTPLNASQAAHAPLTPPAALAA